ncbi:RNA-directed RNA polymerase like protein [Stemphylium lycopersici]|uniref:RNA-directed RNA polymerase like protein n=1 Tax=Stemphylium lycopersici TaxID=183478 RepID=A0A364MTD3_STELY|nr:RNA-directed RNA polymerase like protein [Stemphylium lycopersici]RAR02860.1 RNA-directed RNA polymerase like protein [Stemphylium lycopersici]
MGNLRSFCAVLQVGIDPETTSWDYSVPNFPQAKETDSARLVKCLSFTSTETKQEVVLRFETAPSNRVTHQEPLQKFLLLSLSNFRLRWPARLPGHPSRSATGRENGDYVTRLLTTGVTLNGTHYHFYGHSNSQLKSRSCFLYSASKEEIAVKIEAMGDLSKLKSVGKKAKRIGLFFSSAEMALTLSPKRCEDIEDVKRDDYIFTDGCGLIAPQLARQLAKSRKIIFRNKRYTPSVFQIRYRGYKGVLTLDPTLHKQVLVQFRESMRKFKDASDHSFAVVDYSKPYAFGSLNDEVVVLLHTLGISTEMLLRKQQQHLDFLELVSRADPQAAFQFLSYCDRIDLAEKLLLEGTRCVRTVLGGLVRQEYEKMLNKRDEQRCRILIPKSRLLFGVCDPTSKNSQPGKLKEVFVTWDPDIIPRIMAQPAMYPGGKEPVTFGDVTGDARAEYFARYTSASLGKVKNLYMQWARLGNAMSPQCQQLNRLFSQCVDGNYIRVPEHLQKLEDPPNPGAIVAPFILDVLHDAAAHFIKHVENTTIENSDDADILDALLSREKLAMSEFELLQLVLRWCEQNGASVLGYSHLLDFSILTDEQKIWLLDHLPPSVIAPSLRFRLDHAGLHWKPVFRSSTDRMGRFLPTVSHSLEIFHKKLIILTVDDRLTLAIYVPKKVPKASETQVDTDVRVFVFPHTQSSQSLNYKVIPTKANYRLFCDEHIFQLYERKRANTWIFLRRSHGDDSRYRDEKSKGEKRRLREHTIQNKTNFECQASVNLGKIGKDVQQHVGRVQKAGVLEGEVYVISNRDVQAMHVLDEWLNYVDTDEVLPLFEKLDKDYSVPELRSVDWQEYPETVKDVVRDKNMTQLHHVASMSELRIILDLLHENDEKLMLRSVFGYILDLEATSACSLDRDLLASTLLEFLLDAVYLIPTYMQSQTWKRHKHKLEEYFVLLAPKLLKRLILLAEEMGTFVRHPLALLLRELKRISLQDFAELVELISLTIRSVDLALDILLEVLEAESSRLLVERPMAVRQFTSSLFGIALDHVNEAASGRHSLQETFNVRMDNHKDGYTVAKSLLRVDSSLSATLKVGDHVQLTVSNPPQNAPIAKPFSMDAVVLSAETGEATFRCLHHPPSYLAECAWAIANCGSFVTSKTCYDAVTRFYTEREASCSIYAMLLGLPVQNETQLANVELPAAVIPSLNDSQNTALKASMTHLLTFVWGPPGTGKTHTIVVIMQQLLRELPKARFLITAPTHNAVDNLLRRFAAADDASRCGVMPVRVSTQVSKVAFDLRTYTCDAMLGKDLNANLPARRKAQKRIQEARIIFTTCSGAGLGLLRNENFDVVVIDEASQLTEPATLIPLVKGCSREILVGDHVQLRATVQQNALLTGYDISLFERHYNLPARKGVAKVMLDTQYRMHRSICDFSSSEFYGGRLRTAVSDTARPLPPSRFPWPREKTNKRMVWIECGTPEDLGLRSKANEGQKNMCKRVVELLTSPPAPSSQSSSSSSTPSRPMSAPTSPSIAILTPYTRQRTLLESAIPNATVSSIDGFQGREADIVVFVTVRCNVYGDLGFLVDMRRLNVVMTRARVGVVVIGSKSTLTGGGTAAEAGDSDGESRMVWKRLVQRCETVALPGK